jgi:acyl carrier protein
MNKEEFYSQISDLLELEGELETNDETLIEDVLEIDSLAHITLISFVKDELGFDLKAEDFSKFNTLLDMVSAIGESKFG